MSDSKVNSLYKILIVLFLPLTFGCEKEVIPIPDDIIEIEILSQEVNSTYIVRIYLPDNYNSNNLNYPVLYQLDGNTTTGSVISAYENLIKNNKIIEAIIVAIDYKNGNQRVRDFTPSSLQDFEDSGGSEDFLDFLRYELVPMINQTYRVDTLFGNTLRGHSLGGLFGSYVMFRSQEAEGVFSNFIISTLR